MTELNLDSSGYYQKSPSVSMLPVVWSSLLMAAGGMGDAFLYAFLPVKGEALGLSIFSIGLLLSVNKFTRFFSNRWVAWAAIQIGLKRILLTGFILSVVTTFIYGSNPELWIWIISRVAWGIAYSAMRFSAIQYADSSARPGTALGVARTIQEMGPVLAYCIGPLLLVAFGDTQTFVALAILSLVLIPLFLVLPDVDLSRQEIRPMAFRGPTPIDSWVFCVAFAVEGLVVVGISKLISFDPVAANELILFSAVYISVRRVMVMIASPIAGRVSDTLGFHLPFHVSCLLIVSGLIAISFQLSLVGIALTFLGSAVNFTLVPLLAMESGATRKQDFDALTRLSTSRDIGSALGSLTGLTLLVSFESQHIFLILSLISISLWFKIRNLSLSQ